MKRMIEAIPFARSLSEPLRRSLYERRFSGECYGWFRGVFESFEEAIQSAPKTKKIGYNNSELAEEYKVELKTKLEPYDYPVLFWLKDLVKENVKIFDFGGNVGIHFYSYEKYISYPPSLGWIVCDVPEIVKAGRKLAEEQGRAELVFTCSFEEANGTDIFIASGSIQYVESLSISLDKLSEKPKHLLLNRLPLYDGEQFVTLQNGGKVFYPQYVFNKKDFISSLQALGYELIDVWEDRADSCFVPFYPEKHVPFYNGLYLKLAL